MTNELPVQRLARTVGLLILLSAVFGGIGESWIPGKIIVSGDAYVVQGQSNAEAAKRTGAANVEESLYLRSFGTSNADSAISGADRVWHYATGDVTQQSG